METAAVPPSTLDNLFQEQSRRMQIREQVRQFIIENFLFGQEGDLRDDDSFLEKGLVDSTGVLEVVAFVEQRFGIRVEDTDVVPENLDSIQSIAEFVQRKEGEAMEHRYAG
jgi:acyl carrier protein